MKNGKNQSHQIAPIDIKVHGARAPDGSRWIKVTFQEHTSRWLPFASFRKNGSTAESVLAEQGLVFMKSQFSCLMQMVEDLCEFSDQEVASRIGWSGPNFAFPSGTLITSRGASTGDIAFSPISNRDGTSGSAKAWRKHVARPLAGQPLASFAMMIPFAAPLLRIVDHPTNFGFEFAGSGGIGKSTICKLAMSAIGPMENMTISMNATANAIDQLMSEFNDQVMMLEEWNIMALQGGANAGREAARLAFVMGDGTSKRRFDASTNGRVRFLWLTSTNRPLPLMLEGIDPETAKAALDRTLTIAIPGEREHGIFDRPNERYSSVAEMAEGLAQAAGEYHGTAFRKYLAKLILKRRKDPEALRSRLVATQRHFVEKILESGDASTHRRVIEAFGLVYAAGRVAKHFKVLPAEFDCMGAVEQAYGLHVASRSAVATPVERLQSLLSSPTLLDIREAGEAEETDILSASGVLFRHYGRGDELLLTREQLQALTPNPSAFLKNPTIRACMALEDKRLQVYRYSLPKSGRRRFFCFSLDALQDQGH